MTKEQKEMLLKVTSAVTAAKRLISQAEDKLEEAADSCKGYPMEDHLNSIYDDLYDLRLDLGKQITAFGERLEGIGNEAPASWEEERRA